MHNCTLSVGDHELLLIISTTGQICLIYCLFIPLLWIINLWWVIWVTHHHTRWQDSQGVHIPV